MANYFLTNKAIDDLSDIWNYTLETWSENQADKYYWLLLDTFQEIADGKIIGKKYLEIDNQILGIRAGQHIIFYNNNQYEEIHVLRILHSSMDLKNKFYT